MASELSVEPCQMKPGRSPAVERGQSRNLGRLFLRRATQPRTGAEEIAPELVV